MRSASLLLLFLVALAPFRADGRIYKWVMPDGTIQYSDRPQEEGAQPLDLPPLQVYTPPPTPAAGTGSGDEEGTGTTPEAPGYDSVQVVSPAADEVIRDNGGTVSVQIEIKPPLRSGHTVEILLDGEPIGSGSATSASVTGVDRGSHTVSAVVKDGSGATLARAPAVTFHLKQATRLLGPNASANPGEPANPVATTPGNPANPAPGPAARQRSGSS